MNFLLRYGLESLDAWTSAVRSVPGKILLLCLTGSMGVIIGHVFSLSLPASPEDLFLVVVYPYSLLMNCFSSLGMVIAVLFFSLLIAMTVNEARPVHALGTLLPLQAIETYVAGYKSTVIGFFLLLIFAGAILISYTSLMLKQARQE